MKRFIVCAALVAALTLLAGKAEAGFVVDGGTAGLIPGGSGTNDAVQDLITAGYFTDAGEPGFQVSGTYGAQLRFTGAGPGVQFKFEYFGAEAGFANLFQVDSPAWTTVFSHGGGDTTSGTPIVPSVTFDAADVLTGDLLEFRFRANGTTTNTNGTNPAPLTGFPNFAIAQDNFGGYFLFFDDNGAGPDDNHDDMVVRITAVGGEPGPVVPVPPSMVLALAGAGSFSILPLLRRLRRRAAA